MAVKETLPKKKAFFSFRPSRLTGLGSILLVSGLLPVLAAHAGNMPAHVQTVSSLSAPVPQQPGVPIHPTPISNLPNFVRLVKEVKPAVVSIIVNVKPAPDTFNLIPGAYPFAFGVPRQNIEAMKDEGAGFIISPKGYIVTNRHVVAHAMSVSVVFSNGKTLPAKIIGTDLGTDLALLKVNAGHPLPFVSLGNSSDVNVGEWVVAVGNPFGLSGTVTAGIVSALGRHIGDGPYDSFIQIDAPINHGNSGGPLFDLQGNVIGVNTAIMTPNGGSVGIGFAIPSDTVKEVVHDLQTYGRVVRGFLGIAAQPVNLPLARALNLPVTSGGPEGAIVSAVEPGSPADKAGLKPGDIITSVNAQRVSGASGLAILVSSYPPGSKISLTYVRNGKTQTTQAVLEQMPQPAGTEATAKANMAVLNEIGIRLTPLTPYLKTRLGVSALATGAVIAGLRASSPAAFAGLQPGDIIIGVGIEEVNTVKEAADAIRLSIMAKNAVALRILRDDQPLFVAVSLGQP